MSRLSASGNFLPAFIALIIIGAGAALFFASRATAPKAAEQSAVSTSARPVPPPPIAASATPGSDAPATESSPSPPSQAEAPLLSGDAAREAITDLAVTYDAASVPALARYLGHSDPEVRSAARDGLIQLGERSAIPFLNAAAKTAPADEAKELREAAEFLALPTWTEQREAQKKAKAAGSAAK